MAEQDRQSTAQPPPLPSVAPPLPRRDTRGSRKTRTGEVISSGMSKTIVVRIVTRVPHPKFGKIVKQMKKFYAHDEENKAKPGDTVRIMETRPLSKLKRWRLVEVLQK
jgi:small subunit ribosomal protein S17